MESNNIDPINESVEVDARKGIFHRTTTRLEQIKAKRIGKIDNYKGLYDDGSGKGVIMPKPISFNKESTRLAMEIDGRTKGLREALKRVEMYRQMREAAKKKALFGGTISTQKESLEESTTLTRGQILDAVGMVNNKYEVTEAELSAKQKEYRAFFQKALKKHDAKSPADMDDEGKKKFFDYVKANWKG